MTQEEFDEIWGDVPQEPATPAPKATMTPPASPPAPSPTKPTIDQLKKVFMRLKQALQDANQEGDKERAAEIRPQFIAIRDALAEARAEGQVNAEKLLVALRKEVQELRAENRTLKVSRNDWKFKHDVLQDEVRTLRNPAPPMTANMIKLPKVTIDEEALEADYQKFFEHLDQQGAELRRQGRV
jgi:hypothetical protein